MKQSYFLFIFLTISLGLSLFNFQISIAKAQQQNLFGSSLLPNWLNVTVTENSDFVIVNNADGFIFKFRKGTGGYNEIWENNSQIVANEQWVLEYLGPGSKWKQRGISQYIIWEQLESYQVIVKRFYNDFLGTTFNITYTFHGGFRPKISFEGYIGQIEDYRIQWKISGINKTYVQNEPSNYCAMFWSEGEEAIVFDYSDVYENFGNITVVEIEEWAGSHKLYEIFNVGSLTVGEFRLDPNFGYETIGTVGDQNINNWIAGSYYTMGATAGTADSITAYIKSWQNNVKCALYLQNDKSLVTNGVTEEKVGPNGVWAWWTFNFNAPKPSVLANTAYYIVIWSGGAGYMKYDTEANIGQEDSEVYNGFPDPLGGSSTTHKCSIYCSYTEVGAIENFYGSINSKTTINSFRTWGVDRYASISQSISIASSKTVSFFRYLTVNPTFTIESIAIFTIPGLLFFYGVIMTLIPVESWNDLVTPITLADILGLASIGFIIAIVALAVAITKKD